MCIGDKRQALELPPILGFTDSDELGPANLADFGIAKIVGDENEQPSNLTATAQAM